MIGICHVLGDNWGGIPCAVDLLAFYTLQYVKSVLCYLNVFYTYIFMLIK